MPSYARIITVVACLAIAVGVSSATDYKNRIYLVPTHDYIYSVGNRDIYNEIAQAVVDKIRGRSPPVTSEMNKEYFNIFKINRKVAGLNDEVFLIINESCIKCHKPGALGPGVKLFNNDRTIFVEQDINKERNRRRKVYESIEGGDMPKGLSPLTRDKKSKIKQWYEEVK